MQKWKKGLTAICALTILLPAAGLCSAQATAGADSKPLPPADPMAVLKAIPAQSTGFITIRNLKEMDNNIVRVALRLGIPLGPTGMFPGPLDFLKGNLAIAEGFNDNGSLALVLLDARKAESFMEVPYVLLVPTTDVEALTAPMSPQEEGGLMVLNFQGQPMYGATKGDFLVLSPVAEFVAAMREAKGKGMDTVLSEKNMEDYKAQDLYCWFDMKAVPPSMIASLGDMLRGLMMFDPNAEPDQINASVDQMIENIDSIDLFTLGMTINSKVGIKFSSYTTIKPDTDMGKMLAATQAPNTPLLIGQPDEPTIFSFGSVGNNSPEGEQQVREVFDQLLSNPEIQEYFNEEQFKELKGKLIDLIISVDQMSAGFSPLPVEGQQGLMGLTLVVKVQDNQKWKANFGELIQTAKKVLFEAAKEEGEVSEEELAAADKAIEYTADADKTDNAAIDQFVVHLAQLPDMDETTVEEAMKVLGEEGAVLRIAAVGKDYVVVTFGGGMERATQIYDLVLQGKAPLAQNAAIQQVQDRLPSDNRLAVLYFNLDQIFTLIANISQTLGEEMPLPLVMTDAAPISMAKVKISDNAVQTDVLIPMEFAESASRMAQPLIGMMMMGGMGGGNQMQLEEMDIEEMEMDIDDQTQPENEDDSGN